MNEQAQPDRTVSEAGHIDNVNAQGWVSVIHCKAGSRRSSHWHRTDDHILHVVSGRMLYWQRPVDESIRPDRPMGGPLEVRPGEQVYTAALVEHWTEFPEDTVLVSVSTLHRTHENHEADLVRVEWAP